MGWIDWLLGRPEVSEAPPPLLEPERPPPRGFGRWTPSGSTVIGHAEHVEAPAFSSNVLDQLLQDLHLLASELVHPDDRLLLSSLRRAVRNDGMELPSMPEDVVRLQRLLASPDCDVGELARAIQRDPAISGRFVAIANSTVYARKERVSTVEDAAVRIGLNQASMIVMAIVSKAKLFHAAGYRQEAAELHRHALAAAVSAQLLARTARVHEQDAFIAGLLHDLGQVFVFALAGKEQRESRGARAPSPQAIERISEVVHAGLGALVATSWGFGDHVVSAIQHHHLPVSGGSSAVVLIPPEAERLTYVLAAADTMAEILLQPERPVSPAVLEVFGALNIELNDDLLAAAAEAFEGFAEQVDGEPAPRRLERTAHAVS